MSYQEIFAAAYSGPLPPAETFAAYEAAVPGTGLRLVRLVEKELDQNWAFKRRGQWMGFIITLAAMGASAWLITNGHNASGFAFVLVSLTPIVGGFLGRAYRAVEARLLAKLAGAAIKGQEK